MQTFSLRKYPLPEAIRHLQGMGVKYVEFSAGSHLPTTASDDQITEARKMAAMAGLKVTAHGVNPFSKDHSANKKVFEFGKTLGIRTITANPLHDAETFASLDKLVAEYDMRIAIHNHGPGSLYDRLDDVVSAIQGHDRRIGACVDCGHFLASGLEESKIKSTSTTHSAGSLGDIMYRLSLNLYRVPNPLPNRNLHPTLDLAGKQQRSKTPAAGAAPLTISACCVRIVYHLVDRLG